MYVALLWTVFKFEENNILFITIMLCWLFCDARLQLCLFEWPYFKLCVNEVSIWKEKYPTIEYILWNFECIQFNEELFSFMLGGLFTICTFFVTNFMALISFQATLTLIMVHLEFYWIVKMGLAPNIFCKLWSNINYVLILDCTYSNNL